MMNLATWSGSPLQTRSATERVQTAFRLLLHEHELLHAPAGRRLAHVQVALIVDAHPVRAQHLANLPAAAAKLADDLEIRPPQDPHLVVGAVSDIEPSLLRIG